MLSLYKLYCIEDDGHVQKGHDCRARDDLGALDRARAICSPHGAEIWHGTRLVARVKPDGTANFGPPITPQAG